MICEKCGAPMQWRCTNTLTRVAKYKCPECGVISTIVVEFKAPVEKEEYEAKHYYFAHDRYIVSKKVNGERLYVGCYGNEDTAKAVVDKMIECDWDKSMLPKVYDELGMKKVNRSWVCA